MTKSIQERGVRHGTAYCSEAIHRALFRFKQGWECTWHTYIPYMRQKQMQGLFACTIKMTVCSEWRSCTPYPALPPCFNLVQALSYVHGLLQVADPVVLCATILRAYVLLGVYDNVAINATKRGEGGVTQVMHCLSRMTIDPRTPPMPGRSTSDSHRPGRHCLHQARSAFRCWSSGMKDELHPTKNSF